VTAILSLLIVLMMSMLVVRVATVALTLTGLSQPLARFQARSAFTGAGFTTNESEKVVQHPVRRRIIMLLMLLGNAGIVTVVSSLILSFSGNGDESGLTSNYGFRIVLLIAGLAGLWTAANSQWLDRHMQRLIRWSLKRWTALDVRDYAGLLHLTGDYVVAELMVEHDDWLSGRTMQQLNLADEGILVLGIERANGSYVGAPRGATEIHSNDTLLLYGRAQVLEELDNRQQGSRGNWEHFLAVERQSDVEKAESVEPAARTTDSTPMNGDQESALSDEHA